MLNFIQKLFRLKSKQKPQKKITITHINELKNEYKELLNLGYYRTSIRIPNIIKSEIKDINIETLFYLGYKTFKNQIKESKLFEKMFYNFILELLLYKKYYVVNKSDIEKIINDIHDEELKTKIKYILKFQNINDKILLTQSLYEKLEKINNNIEVIEETLS